ncbi:MAG: FHA domain-containing protein [Planctomycetaceae bacterium]|nr:FHA domain-containing protein [Planctomycetaceae bacterium]
MTLENNGKRAKRQPVCEVTDSYIGQDQDNSYSELPVFLHPQEAQSQSESQSISFDDEQIVPLLNYDNTQTSNVLPYRSLNRQPMAILTAFDDGLNDQGEQWRIRTSRFVIGHSSGECVIANDTNMSAEHAEIKCRKEDEGYLWDLTDLKSTNGTYLRVKRIVLRAGREVIIGSGRYVYHSQGHWENKPAPDSMQTAFVPCLPADAAEMLLPRLVAKTDSKESIYLLRNPQSWFGSASECEHTATNDPFLDSKHCRIFQDHRNRWVIGDNNSINGIWVRVDRVSLDSNSQFQLGSQRFMFQIM